MASRLVTRHYDRALAGTGITVNGYAILARLDREGPLPLGVLAARLLLDRTTLSREIGPLISSGLVDAAPDPGDRRRRVLSLTAAGTGLVSEARPLWARAQEELASGFGAARTEELVGELHALVGAGA